MTILHVGDIDISEEDRAYIAGAIRERGQAWAEFVREALLMWAAH